jgi:hypothetical protein
MCGNNIHCHKTINVAIDPRATKYCTWQYSLLHQNIPRGNTSILLQLNSMHIHPNTMYEYVAKKAIPTIWVIATIIDCNVSLRCNNHDYCNDHKNHCKVLLQRYYLQQFLTKVTLLLLEGIATNMALLQPYFTMAIDQFSSSGWSRVPIVEGGSGSCKRMVEAGSRSRERWQFVRAWGWGKVLVDGGGWVCRRRHKVAVLAEGGSRGCGHRLEAAME